MALSPEIASLIVAAAQRYGQPADYMLRTAQIESGGNPAARNPSGAAGLFQFIPSTARAYGLSDPMDPAASADAAARLARDNGSALSRALGRDPTPGELYLAHQQGAGGASKLLANPDAPAASLVGRGAVVQNGGSAGMSAADFAGLWTGKFDGAGRAAQGGSDAPAAAPFGFRPPSTGSDVAAPQPAPAAPDDTADIAAILRTLMPRQQEQPAAAPQEAPAAAPMPMPEPQAAPPQFDAARAFALLPATARRRA